MNVKLRGFCESDIPLKVKWINDEENNRFLHYDLPLTENKTYLWYSKNTQRKDRLDLTILFNEEPAGLIGLLNIKNTEAEYYICMGGGQFKGKGIATIATRLLFEKAKRDFSLNRIYLYTEVDNINAQKLFERCGFKKKSLLKKKYIV